MAQSDPLHTNPSEMHGELQGQLRQPERLIVGISGASGSPLALRLLQTLADLPQIETHVIMTRGARLTARYEVGDQGAEELMSLADAYHELDALGDSIASGTFKTLGMVVIPCSMKTVAGIATGYSDNLLLRAADVTIKEKRPLVLVTRETPLSPIHLNNMMQLAAIPSITLMPPMMTYYIQPETIADMETHLVAKVLERFGIELSSMKRWGEQGLERGAAQ